MDRIKGAVFSIISIVFLAIAESAGQQTLCSSPMSLAVRSNYIIIQNISESTPPNSTFATLIIVGTAAEISLRLEPANDNIRLNATSRELIVSKSFNVTGGSPENVNINIICTVTATGVTTNYIIVIQIYDMNNNPPWFTNLPYSVNISERTPINSTIFSGVQAFDVDPSDRGYLIFSVADCNNFSSYFSFPVSTVGNIMLMRSLDYEAIQTFNLTITVTDNGNNLTILGQLQPQYTATASILINVLPADDFNPVFNQATYSGVLTIDDQLNRSSIVLPPIDATIRNARPDERIFYSILKDGNNADSSCFIIDNQTGVINTSPVFAQFGLLSDVVAFQIQATRVTQNYRYGRALVRLSVLRTANPLKFTQRTYAAFLEDATPNGTLAVTVVAVNGLSSPMYYLNSDVKDFTIDSKTGEIRTATNMNYNKTTFYNFTVTANNSQSVDICRVIVTVTRLNKYNPRFAQPVYIFNITENTSFVGQIMATDEDPNAVLSYRLIDSSSCFNIDNSGQLSCRCSSVAFFSNLTIGNTRSLIVIAEDDSDPPRQTSALVQVTWNTSSQPEQPVQGHLCEDGVDSGRTKAFYIAVIALGVIAGLFLIIIFILGLCLCRRSRMNADHRPRITIEVDRAPQKSQNSSSHGSRKSGNGFEVAKEYGPYHAYGSSNTSSNDVITQSPSALNSSDKLQKLKLYQSVPIPRIGKTSASGNGQDPLREAGDTSTVSRKPPQHHHRAPPYSSTSISTASSPPSSRVERYKFDDDVDHPRGSHHSKSVSVSPELSSRVREPELRSHSVPGPRKGSRLQATMMALRDSNSGDTSSTETLVNKVTMRARPSNVSFVENTGGYLSSQEGLDVSMSALTRTDTDPAITVYY